MTANELLSILKIYMETSVKHYEQLKIFSKCIDPFKCWINGIIPRSNKFMDGDNYLRYSFHGRECEIETNHSKVDIQFDLESFNITFDDWRIYLFISDNKYPYKIETDEIQLLLDELENNGHIVKTHRLNNSFVLTESQ